MALDGIVVEMRDQMGKVKQTVKTNEVGHYRFTGVTIQPHFVTPAMDRTWAAQPNQATAIEGDQKDFKVRGVPVVITVTTAKPATFTLLSVSTISAANPPNVDMTATNQQPLISAVSGRDKIARLRAPADSAWYLTCWTEQSGRYVRTDSVRVPGTPGNPRTQIAMSCP